MTSLAEGRRIGGEFELDWRDLCADSSCRQPLPTFAAEQEVWLDTGRSALALIARQRAKEAATATIWLPAYSCASIVSPFLRQGLQVRFYPVGATLDGLNVSPLPGDTLLFIHYFGLRNEAALSRVDELRSASVCLIEDCVQAALTDGLGRYGDYALTSLRKLLAQPDGALLAARQSFPVDISPADEAFVSARLAGKLLRGAGGPDATYLSLFAESEARLADDRPRAMSWLSHRLLSHCDLNMVAVRRRANYTALRQGLGDLPASVRIRPLLPFLQVAEVPLGCPVVVGGGQRDSLRRYLAERGVFCPVHWDLAHVGGSGFAAEQSLAASLLTLPIDQRYGEADMARIIEFLSTFSGGGL